MADNTSVIKISRNPIHVTQSNQKLTSLNATISQPTSHPCKGFRPLAHSHTDTGLAQLDDAPASRKFVPTALAKLSRTAKGSLAKSLVSVQNVELLALWIHEVMPTHRLKSGQVDGSSLVP
jgi:hypothetical protein